MKKILGLIAVAVALTACGGGSSHGGSGPVVVQPDPPTPAPLIDAFFTRVSGFASSLTETEEAGDISAVVATEPENTEPVAL
jgi:hypothetical protein